MRSIRQILLMLAGSCLALVSNAQPAQAPAPEPVLAGSQVCQTCHVPYDEHKAYVYHKDCLACHTPTDEKHLVEGGKTMQFPDAEKCLGCHKKQDIKRKNWAFSEHGKARLDCRDCHGIHQPKRPKQFNLALWKTDKKSAVCMGCHQDVAGRMNMSSHHPVKEGALSCVSCHDPHAAKQTTQAAKNDKCFECHQAIRGPKVFEHAPVVEDCTICHNPHGSPNRRLLQVAQPMQCLQCHSLSPMHGQSGSPRGIQLRGCTNCHGAIHGSHSDPKLKY
jgi:DmsE family decaheme c-type cytochrome